MAAGAYASDSVRDVRAALKGLPTVNDETSEDPFSLAAAARRGNGAGGWLSTAKQSHGVHCGHSEKDAADCHHGRSARLAMPTEEWQHDDQQSSQSSD